MSRPREKMVSVKMSNGEWWIVGLGGGTHGPKKSADFFFFFFLNRWDVTDIRLWKKEGNTEWIVNCS